MLPEESPAQSPLEALSNRRFEGHTYINEGVTTLGATRVVLLPNNPNRLFWILINEGLNDVRVSTSPDISAVSGWLVPASGGIISMFWEQDGEGVGYTLYGIATVGAPDVRVREVVRE